MTDNGARGKVHLSQEELNLDKMEVRVVAQGGMVGTRWKNLDKHDPFMTSFFRWKTLH